MSSKNAENTLVLVEFEAAKEDASRKYQNSEDSSPAEFPTPILGNPFLPSPEKEKESNETSQIMTRSKCQQNIEY